MPITVKKHDDVTVTPYEELALPQASPQTDWSLDGGTMIRYLKTSWEASGDLLGELIGYVGGYTGGDNPAFDFFLPKRYGGPGDAGLRVVRVGEAPFGKSEAHAPAGEFASYTRYPDSFLTVTYENTPKNWLWMLFDEDFQLSTDFVTIPGRKLWWNAGNTEPVGEDESPGKLFHRGDWTYTIKRIPKLRTEFWSHQGKVNNAVVPSWKYNVSFTIGTLLYEGMASTVQTNHLGDTEFRVEERFAYNSLGWNKFPRAGKDEVQTMYDADGEFKLYEEADLNDLLLT